MGSQIVPSYECNRAYLDSIILLHVHPVVEEFEETATSHIRGDSQIDQNGFHLCDFANRFLYAGHRYPVNERTNHCIAK